MHQQLHYAECDIEWLAQLARELYSNAMCDIVRRVWGGYVERVV